MVRSGTEPLSLESSPPGDGCAFNVVDAALCVPCGNKLGECPLWDDRRRLLCWLDIDGRKFLSFDPSCGEAKSFDLPARAGSFCISESGEYVFAFEDGFSFYDPASGERLRISESFEPELRTRLNDGRVDRQGRFVAGGHVEKGNDPVTGVYRLNSDLSVERLFQGVRCSNSIAFSLDGQGMFFADTMKEEREILHFPEYAASAMRGPSETFVQPEGRPDGSTIDSEGFLWNAEFGGGRVVRYAPDGRVDTVVKVPVKYTTCCALGGSDMRTLYITDASVARLSKKKRDELPEGYPGGLFAAHVAVPGVPEQRFGGSSASLRST